MWFKNKDEATYLDKVPNAKLIKFIKDLDLSESSRESLLFMVSRYIEYFKLKNSYLDNYKNEAIKLRDNRNKTDGENTLDIKEEVGYMKYNELILYKKYNSKIIILFSYV